jgi:hypothetical protein
MYFFIVQKYKVVDLKKRSQYLFQKEMNGNHIVYSLGSNICENNFFQNHAMKDFGFFFANCWCH